MSRLKLFFVLEKTKQLYDPLGASALVTVRREKTPFLQEEISSRTRLRAGWPSAMTGLGEGRKTGQ